MARLIDADKLIEEGWILERHGESNKLIGVKSIADVPTVEAKEVVHGEWVKTFRYMRENINTGKLEPVYSCDCPICKWHTGNQGTRFNFCPNCEADMRTSAE